MPRVARAQQDYPNRPIRFVLPFGAGGVADITSRLAAEKLGDKLGQRFVVENQPGPGGIAAARSVLTAAPDGYTLGLVTNGTSISVAIYNALPFDPVKDFAPISTLGYFDLVFATNAAVAVQDAGGLHQGGARAARQAQCRHHQCRRHAEPRRPSCSSRRPVSNFQIIPYRGTPDIIVALLRNDVQLMVDFYAPMKGALVDKQDPSRSPPPGVERPQLYARCADRRARPACPATR